jgi:hypothetical protein
MNSLAPIFADINVQALVRIVVVLLFVLVPLIGQVLAKIRQIPPPNKRPLPPRPELPDVAEEIEDFMRRAAERQAVKRTKPQMGEAGAASSPDVPVGKVPSGRRDLQPAAAEASAQEKPVGGQVSEHVQKYLDEQEFRRREAELGKQVARSDQQIDQHFQQVFDHSVSKLEATPGEAAAAPAAYEPPDLVGAAATAIPATFATGLLDLVTDPDSLRQAIVLNELLRRPEERWG